MCVCLCVCAFAIITTPFNLELSNFGIIFFMWISKNGFLNFWNIVIAISLRFLCKFEEHLLKNQWRWEWHSFFFIINQHAEDKSSKGNVFPKSAQIFFCIPVFLLDCLPGYDSKYSFEILKLYSWCNYLKNLFSFFDRFFDELLHFFHFSLRFLCKFKD